MGIIVACFQWCGMWQFCMERLKRSVRAEIAVGPRCFSCMLEMLSGPSAVDGLSCFNAVAVSAGVKRCRLWFMGVDFTLRFRDLSDLNVVERVTCSSVA